MSDFEYIIKELKAKRFELAVLEQKIKNNLESGFKVVSQLI